MQPEKLLRQMAEPWRNLLGLAEAELMPCRCPFCGTNVHGAGHPVCPGCLDDLRPNRPACRSCAMPLATEIETACAQCQARPPPFFRVIAPFIYDYPLDAAIRRMKYRRKLYYLPGFSRLLLPAAEELPADLDGILPVPLHRWRLVTRGFNQAYELARPVAGALGLPLMESVCRSRHTRYQSGLGLAQRGRNLKGAFRVCRPIAAGHVLIVDDVMTTGTTCGHIAAVLKAEGVARVSVLVLARATGD